jgi:hypothetical protein
LGVESGLGGITFVLLDVFPPVGFGSFGMEDCCAEVLPELPPLDSSKEKVYFWPLYAKVRVSVFKSKDSASNAS